MLRPSAQVFKEKVGTTPVIMLEAGVYRGYYSKELYAAFNCERLYLMDTWNRSYEGGKYVVPEILEYAKTAMSFFDNCPNVMMIKFSTLDFDLFQESYFDYVYLDNDHSYNHCVKEFEKYWHLVKHGGMISGDNLEAPGVSRALHEFCDKYKLNYEHKPWKVKNGKAIASDWWIWK
jgi:hypothetical protein